MRVFVNGSLNVPREVMQARSAILARRGEGTGFAELLDRHQIDVFFGSGMPVTATSTRAPPYTATHLERTAGWLLVFRNMRGALYLRLDAHNASNLQRMVDYYARHGVPFDPEHGFDPSLAIRDAMRWSVDNGVVPIRFPQIEENSRSRFPAQQAAARERLASIFVLIGLYERAERMDRRTLRIDPEAVAPARRLVWSLLHQGRYDDARLEAERLAARASPDDVLGQRLVAAARFAPNASDEQKRSIVATLPLFTPPELRYVTANLAVAEARPPPDRASLPGAVRPRDQ